MRARITGALAIVTALAGLAGALAQIEGGCAASPVTVPVRSLQRSGQVSFVCLNPPGSAQIELPLSDCTAEEFTSTCQYNYEDDAGNVDAGAVLPHLYALVTQTTQGEVAVVDTSALAGSVLDQNPREPGSGFIHVGALPTGIASSPGSVATFVGVGEMGREGIYALPSSQIRPQSASGIPDTCLGVGGEPYAVDGGIYLYNQAVSGLTSWPACHLPSAPGDIVLVEDPLDCNGNERKSCGDPYSAQPTANEPLVFQEGMGRPKLVIALPLEGGLIVVDAQRLLDPKLTPPGSFDDCVVERWLPLQEPSQETLAQLAAQPAQYTVEGSPSNPACGNPAPPTLPITCTKGTDCPSGTCTGGLCSYTPQPGSISYASGTLYVADLGAPVIHVIDMRDTLSGACGGTPVLTPCNPVERPPLLPSSAEEPTRVVFASKVSVAPLPTPDLKRYLYATDVEDASVMVFDVSDGATSRRPLVRQHPEYNPFQPRDRVKFIAPPADVAVVQRDAPRIDPVTGIAKAGVLCNPDPNALVCIASSSSCDIGTAYRTSTDYTSGAGPAVLRGEFAFAALTDGKLGVIDVSDFDAPCRTPLQSSALAGCGSNGTSQIDSAGDVSCDTVQPFSQRSGFFTAVGTDPGNHVPGILTYPLLYNDDGSSFVATPTAMPPQMFATLPAQAPKVGTAAGEIPPACQQSCDPNQCGTTCDTLPGCPLQLFVGGVQTPVNLDENGNACNGSAPCTVDADCPAPACDITQTPPVCPDGTACSKESTCPAGVCDPELHVCAGATTCTGTNCYTPGLIGPNSAPNNALLMNLEDPRGQIVDQNWAVTYEGSIPGFSTRLACLYVAGSEQTCVTGTPASPTSTLSDPNSRFCDSGVLSEKAFSAMLGLTSCTADGDTCATSSECCPGAVCAFDGSDPETPSRCTGSLTAPDLADYVQMSTDLLSPDDPYWTNAVAIPDAGAVDAGQASAGGTVYQPSCSYIECLSLFGTLEQFPLNTNRDMRILEAYQDHLEIEMRNKDVPVGCTPDGQVFAGGQPCCSGAADLPAGGMQLVCNACPASNPSGCVSKPPSCNKKGMGCTRPLDIADLKCCFPGELNYAVRGGTQWMVVGDQSGLIHHVVADESLGGACRNSCDPAASRKNSRVIESPPTFTTPVSDRSPTEVDPSPRFMNPMFRFALASGAAVCATDADCARGYGCNGGACNPKVYTSAKCDLAEKGHGCATGKVCDCSTSKTSSPCVGKCYGYQTSVVQVAPTTRDSVFRFSTNGSFSGMLLPLATDPSVLVDPQRITYLSATGEVVITDGSFNGIIFVSLSSAAVSRSFF